MSNLFMYLAIFFIVVWLVGYFNFNPGGLIHILLVLALVSFIIQVLR